MPESTGLWKHQNDLLGTKSVSLDNVKVGHYTEEKGDDAPVYSVTSFEASYVGCICV